MSVTTQNQYSVWDNALLAAAVVCVEPAWITGILVRSYPGPVRDKWLKVLRSNVSSENQITKIPSNVTEDRLLGGIDLTATLRCKQPVIQNGLLASADGGIVLLPMAERSSSMTIACLCNSLDFREVILERDGISSTNPTNFSVVALDEGEENETLHPALLDRLAIHIDLNELSVRDIQADNIDELDILKARERLPSIATSEADIKIICATAISLGIESLRACIYTLNIARVIAALNQHDSVQTVDITMASQLVLAPRAIYFPSEETEPEPEENPEQDTSENENNNESKDSSEQDSTEDTKDEMPDLPEELILEAIQAAIPKNILQNLNSNKINQIKSGTAGKAGENKKTLHRGRPVGDRRGKPGNGQKLNILATLRAAVPWQKIRRIESGDNDKTSIMIRSEDFRLTRFKQKSETATIFVVDASGSSALNRLAEVKGAVELVLAECYVRRDQVALVAFRGVKAEVLLAPTHSLVHAKRSLANLPGGGGTPLASGIDSAYVLAMQLKQRGTTPTVIFLTDGRANVARDGTQGRQHAFEDALVSARNINSEGIKTLVIDTSPRAHENSKRLAKELHAEYLPLPYADAESISNIVQASTQLKQDAA